VAVFGLGFTLLSDFQRVNKLDYVATDYKTLYASAALFREGHDPYQPSAVTAIYHRDGVVAPHTSFGHMPVYPPVTLLVLWPLTYLDMGASAMAWWAISMGIVAAGIAMLTAEARRQELSWPYRAGLIAFAVSTPMLGYTLNIGNVSAAAGALCMIALMTAIRESQARAEIWNGLWIAGGCLGLALCVKPHLALWVAAGIALACGAAGRRIAATGAAVCGVLTLISVLVLWARGALATVLGSLVAMLHQERSGGSMSPESREVLPVLGQITGLNSLLGLHFGQPMRGWLVGTGLAICFGALLVAAWQKRWGSPDPAWQVLFVSATFAVGMVASYHRAHDAVLLAGLLGLWICGAVRGGLKRECLARVRWFYAGSSAALLCILLGQWFTVPGSICIRVAGFLDAPWTGDLLALRQGALAAACLAAILVVLVNITGAKKDGTNGLRSVPGGQ
jgi:hypothetical protein